MPLKFSSPTWVARSAPRGSLRRSPTQTRKRSLNSQTDWNGREKPQRATLRSRDSRVELRPGLRPDDAVGDDLLTALERTHGGFGLAAEHSVDGDTQQHL